MAHNAPPLNHEQAIPLSGALIFTRPQSLKGDTAGALSVSLVLHVLVAIGAVWLTLNPVKKIIAQDDMLIPMVVEKDQAQQDVPPPPPPPNTKMPDISEIAKGFQTLTVPTVIPPDIPPPTAGPEINEADFSGEGKEGGLARGSATGTKTVTTEDISAAPVFTPYTVEPQLLNREEISRLLVRLYPVMLRDAGIGGTVMMWIFVDASGNVRNTRVKESSGLTPLDSAAVKVTEHMRFRPAQNRDVRVPVWVALPVNFKVE